MNAHYTQIIAVIKISESIKEIEKANTLPSEKVVEVDLVTPLLKIFY